MQTIGIIFLLLLLCVAGCGAHQGESASSGTSADDALMARRTTHWEEMPLKIQQSSVAVKQGPTPLVFIFESAAAVRIVDLTANVQIAAAAVGDRTLVRIDDRHGVIAGDQTLAPGPLPAGHQYVIYSDPTTENVVRQGVGPPAMPVQPATRPAVQSGQQP